MSVLEVENIAVLESGSPDISAMICETRQDKDMPTDAWDERNPKFRSHMEVPLYWQLPAVLTYATLLSFWRDCEL